MKVYLRKLTNNDTKKQIETTLDAFDNFFGGDSSTKGASVITRLTAPNGQSESFRISQANGNANSFRFASAQQGGISLSKFVTDNVKAFNADDILKISDRDNLVEIIQQGDSEYDGLNSLIRNRKNPVIISDDHYLIDSLSAVAKYLQYIVQKDYSNDFAEFNSKLIDTRTNFLAKFSVDKLSNFSSSKLFGKKEDDSLAYNLSDNPDYNIFGSAKQSNTIPVNWNKDDFISFVQNVCNYIDSNNGVSNLNEYEDLWNFMDGHAVNFFNERIWVKKYFHILYPEIFVSQLNNDNKIKILDAFKIIPESSELKLNFQISQISQLSNIPTDFFWYLTNSSTKEDVNDKVVNQDENLLTIFDLDIKINSNCREKGKYSYNRIFFGAPGTGKSYELEKQRKELLANGGEYERVTFHPDYSYSQFVGTYKPVPIDDEKITYEYVPGPFMRILVKALLNSESENPYLLIVEEINRANVSAVFGEVFQLLDRGNGISEYAINLSEDMKKYIIKQFRDNGVILEPSSLTEIKLPDNLFIWSSMNSADQGVFPMDTAFKRRWDFEYFGIDDNDEKVSPYSTDYDLNWNQLRKSINELLSTDKFKINEDKLLGPFFVNPKSIAPKDSYIMDGKTFNRVFKNKVIMYLFDDAAKQRRGQLFATGLTRYSQICSKFDSNFDSDGKLVTNIESLFDIFQEKNLLLHSYDPSKYGKE